MKNNIFSRLAIGAVAVLGTLALGSCTVDVSTPNSGEGPEGLAIKVYSPTKVFAGQVVTISGVDLDKVSSVEFGDKSVTDFELVSTGMIRVVVPAGVTEGELSVSGDGGKATAAVPMTIGTPAIATIAPSDRAVGVGGLLTMTGTDMEFFEKAIFPGPDDTTVEVGAMNFVRKLTGSLLVKVPAGIVSGPSAIKLIACNGSEFLSGIVELSADAAGGYTPPGILEGLWQWDTNSGWGGGGVWGGGGYLSDYASTWGPAAVGDWFDANYPAAFPAEYSAAGEGLQAARMVFKGPEMSKIRANGDVVTGTYAIDWTKTKMNANGDATWAMGELAFDKVTPLFGVFTYSTPPYEPMVYDIIKYTGTQMVLAAAPEGTGPWGNATFWAFSRVGSTVTSLPADVDLVQGQAITFAGIDLTDYWIDPDWFLPIKDAADSFVFNGADGKYRILNETGSKYLRVQPLNGDGSGLATTQADGSGAVWVLGMGVGKPAVGNAPGWNPGRGIALTPIGGGKHQITVIGGEQIDGTFNFKFFHQDGWGGEFNDPDAYTNNAATMIKIGRGQDVNGSDPGNLSPAGVAFKAGVKYQITLDLSGGTGAPVLSVMEIPVE